MAIGLDAVLDCMLIVNHLKKKHIDSIRFVFVADFSHRSISQWNRSTIFVA